VQEQGQCDPLPAYANKGASRPGRADSKEPLSSYNRMLEVNRGVLGGIRFQNLPTGFGKRGFVFDGAEVILGATESSSKNTAFEEGSRELRQKLMRRELEIRKPN